MIVGLLIGKQHSTGVPGKNLRPILGRPACEYGFMAAKNSKHIQRIYTSTDSPEIASIGAKYGAVHIARPSCLAQPDSLTEDVLLHALGAIEEDINTEVDLLCLFFANNPAVDVAKLDSSIDALLVDSDFDSAFSVSKYNMFSPARAKRIDQEGKLIPFLEDLNVLGPISSLRGSQGDCYFVDFAIQVMRRRCIVSIEEGQLPLKWIGKKCLPVTNEYGFDIDTEWQFTVIEKWLKDHGFENESCEHSE